MFVMKNRKNQKFGTGWYFPEGLENTSFRCIFHFDHVNDGWISHILCVKWVTSFCYGSYSSLKLHNCNHFPLLVLMIVASPNSICAKQHFCSVGFLLWLSQRWKATKATLYLSGLTGFSWEVINIASRCTSMKKSGLGTLPEPWDSPNPPRQSLL